MNDIALVTANFGAIDDIKPLPAHEGIDAFLYVDQDTAARLTPEVRATWTHVVVPNYPRYDFSNRLRAKYFKLQIHRLEEIRPYRWFVWADSSLIFASLDFVVEWCGKLSQLAPYKRALFIPHPERKTILQEYEFVMSEIARGVDYMRVRYQFEKLAEQMDYIRARGWDVNARLLCGTMWIIENSLLMHGCWDAWWDQNLRYGIMDQLPLPVVLEHHGIVPQSLDIHLYKNQYFTWVFHPKVM